MNIEWSNPYFLIMILPTILLLWYLAKKYGRIGGSISGKRTMLCVRSMVCILLILAMAGPSVRTEEKTTTTLFLVDTSASTKGTENAAKDFLKQADKNRKNTDTVGLIPFGEKASLEGTIGRDSLEYNKWDSFVNPEATDIENAMQIAGSLLPTNTRRRIVLLSDGVETQGDLIAGAKRLKGIAGLTVDVFPLPQEEEGDAQISDIKLARAIRINTDYEIAMQIDSNVDQMINVKLFKGKECIANQWVMVVKGRNNLLFHDQTKEGGSVVYRGEITAENDSVSRNNKAYAYTNISDVPQVLLIAKEGRGDGLYKILQGAGHNVTETLPEGAPTGILELSRYDAVLLCDVAITELPKEFPTALEGYLKTTGGGLFVSGGEHSYALGGYMDTKLEEILPVDMDLKKEGEEPSLGMVMIIDRSGSMTETNYGISKLEMAKEAAIRSLTQFKEKDSLGVIAFDDGFIWTTPIQQTSGNQEAIEKAIASISPGGGTSILPGLMEGFDKLSKTDAKQKHIILLTDGQAEQAGYDSLLMDMKKQGITLSTIAVGSGADVKLLKRLAESGGGRYYQTDVFSDLPEIFAKETILAGKEYIRYGDFYPIGRDLPTILAGVTEVPMLKGFIAATAKPRADVVLQTDKQEPILAFWQYGLGRSAAWTSDVGGMFSSQWITSREGTRILLNAISYVTKKPMTADLIVTAVPRGNHSLIRMETPFTEGYRNLQVTMVSENGEPVATDTPIAVAPGVYEFEAKAKEGAYFFNLTGENAKGEQEIFQTGFAVPYPKEFDQRGKQEGQSALGALASATGGRVLTNGEQVFEQTALPVASPKNLSTLLLSLALIVFLLDVAFRRLPSFRQFMENFWKKCGNYLSSLNNASQKRSKGHGIKKLSKSGKGQKSGQASSSIENPQTNTQASPATQIEKAKPSTAEILAKSKRNRKR